MLFNYIKIAFRNLSRNKVYSTINILGLSLGIACCLLLSLYIQDEFTFDNHHRNINDIYRIITEFKTDQGVKRMITTSPPIALTMGEEIAEIESAARVLSPPDVSRNLIRYEDKLFYETDGFIADSSVFDILTYDFVQGNERKSLVDANSVVLSDKLAEKLFGSELAFDKIISISQGGRPANYKVTGVFKDSYKSHIKVNFFTSMMSSGLGEYIRTNPEAKDEWSGQNFIPAYVKLLPGASKEEVIRKMNEVLMKYGAEDMKAQGREKTLTLEAVKDIYLRSDINKSPRITYIYIIGSIAVFILLIACINFMNLSTAKATKRASEIGIRKVMGAVRSSLIGQILGEAMVIVSLSILIGVVMVQLGLPLFNQLTGKTISFQSENAGFFVLALVGITIITGIVAGSYPAFYLSSFQPAQTLKGKFSVSNSSGWLRQSLVVFQFMIAITLVCGMLIISKQLKFMREKDLGFDSGAKVVLPLRTESARSNYDNLHHELQQNSAVKLVSGVDYVPGSYILSDLFFYPDGGRMETAVLIRRNRIDFRFLELMDIKLIAGRDFTDNRVMEEGKVILNRTASDQLGFKPEDIVGQHIYAEWNGEKFSYEVIGVMEDYHQTNLKEAIAPTLFELHNDTKRYDNMVVSVTTDNFEATSASLEKTWKGLIADTPFEYYFLDVSIQQLYDEDKKMGRIITSFTFIAMLISCLGLYGLSSYMAERRFKEIGVRKVMGATITQIVSMMSKEFIKLVLIAFAIAVPLAWYVMSQWLLGFAYRITIDPTLFLLAGLSALVVALLTVSFESLRAALHNPVDSLRNE